MRRVGPGVLRHDGARFGDRIVVARRYCAQVRGSSPMPAVGCICWCEVLAITPSWPLLGKQY